MNLSLHDVSFRYKDKGPDILEHVTVSFQQGELVALTGRNGSGKTTITRIITGLEKPKSGSVEWDGKDITMWDAAERSRFIGYVFQQPDRQMFMPTVREEVAFGPRQQGKNEAEIQAIVTEALKATDLADRETEYPRSLSRGDKQRVAIASAIAMSSKYLILDEPTSGQDGREKKNLIELLHSRCQKGMTVILVTHDMDIAAGDCSRIIVVADHKIAFDGTAEALFSQDRKPESWGLTYPVSVVLGRTLPGNPYCGDIEMFMECYEKVRRNQ